MDEQDRELIDAAGAPGGDVHLDANYRRAFAELIVSHKDALQKQATAADDLGRRMWWLNFWLFVVAVVTLGLTLVQVLTALNPTMFIGH